MGVNSSSDSTTSEEEHVSPEGPSGVGDSASASASSSDSENTDSDRDAPIEEEDEKRLILLFYETLLLELMDQFSVEHVVMKYSIRHLINNYRQVSHGSLPTEIDYTRKDLCLGYLHRYAACHTVLVFEAMTEILNLSASDALLFNLRRSNLNVMFLGGGPGNDFVGFLTALHGRHDHLFSLDATVVDKMSGWEDVFGETIRRLRQGKCGKAGAVFEDVDVTTSFISADLKDSEELDEDMEAKMEAAHIVFLVKTLSHIPDRDKLQVLQNIAFRMKRGSFLIYIDYPYPSGVFAALSRYLTLVYQSLNVKPSLNYVCQAFGCENITSCKAEVRVYQR